MRTSHCSARCPCNGYSLLNLLSGGDDFDVFFVDATGGNDANDGMSQGQAWQTLTRVNGETFAPNAHVLFKRGEVFRGELEPSNGGAIRRHVVFDAYGSGADPVINGSRLIITWVSTVGEEYSAACAFTPGHVYDDNDQLTLGPGAGALARGEYFWVANVLHVRLSDGGNPNDGVMEASYNIYNIEVGYSYMTFRNLYCDKCKTAAIRMGGAVPNLIGIVFEDITSIRAGQDAFRLGGGGAAQNPNNITLNGCAVQLWDRDSFGSYPAIYQREGDGSGGNNLIIRHCHVDGWIPWGVNTNGMDNGIQVDGGDGITIHNNEINGCDHGIVLTNTATAWDVAYNWIHETGDDGFFFLGVDSAVGKVYNNVLYRCSDQMMDFQAGAVAGSMGLFANNTCYESLNGSINLVGDNGCSGTIKNNICIVTQGDANINVVDVGSTINIADFDFNNNLYYDTTDPPVGVDFAHFQSGNQTWGQWQAAGRDVNGVTANPDLVNAGGVDADDYKVNVGSPAINAGETIAAIIDDYEDIPRPQGVAYDIGAFER